MNSDNYILKTGSIADDISNYEIRMAVVGYRGYMDYAHIKRELDEFQQNNNCKINLIVSGGCKGVDMLGEKWADENNVPKLILMPTKGYGNRRFALRDQEIVNACTHMLAFPSNQGKGTQLTIGMARKKKNVQINVIDITNL